MIEAYKTVVFENYANFNGRAARPEYWWFALASLIIYVGMVVLSVVLSAVVGELGFGMIIIYGIIIIYSIATILPSLAVTVRRLHDIDKSAWWLLIGLIPWIGGIIFLILMVLKTYPHPNKYGNPEGWQNAVSA